MDNDIGTQVGKMILQMREYQKEHNIKKECVTNVKFIYDVLIQNCIDMSNIKVIAVIALSFCNETKAATCTSGHLVLLLDNETIIEPSYDVYSRPNVQYFDTAGTFINAVNKNIQMCDLKRIIQDHIDFRSYADRIQEVSKNKYYYALKKNIPMKLSL